MSEHKRKIAGIDLGTTYSAIAHFDEYGKADIIPNSDNERITPSVILFEDDEVIVGKIAKNQAVSNPENVVQFVKRHMGEPDWTRVINGRVFTPEVLSAIILKRVISDAEESIGEKITDAVITVPAYFNDVERKATMDSGRIAGVNVMGLINEPTAAVLAYGMNNLDKKLRALVYDLGGGTFDVTIVEIDGNNVKVLATAGERRLGGKDWDDMLLNHVADAFVEQHDIDPRDDPEANQDLINKVEEAKKALSRKPRTKVFAQCAGKSLKIEVSREQFEELTLPLLEQTETYLSVVLEKAGVSWDDLDVLLMVGGSTRMPMVEEMLTRVTGKMPEKGINPDECVALGAVYWGAILLVREAEELREKVSAGEATPEEVQAAEEAQGQLNETVPEEIVGMLEGVVVQNVNSHSLGIVMLTKDGSKKNLIMIPEQTPLPAETTKIFGTYKDNQVSVEINICEGESSDPEDCTRIGKCVISDLPPNRPMGSHISVTYHYDEDGRIHVVARDQESGQEVRTEIVRDAAMSDDELARQGDDVNTMMQEGLPAAPGGDLRSDTGPVDSGYYQQQDQYGEQGQYQQDPYATGQYAAEGYADGYAEGEYSDDQYAEPQQGYTQDQYAPQDQYAQDQYAPQDQYAQDQYGSDQYAAQGEYGSDQYATGEYAEGDYGTGEYQEGQYQEGQYQDGQYQDPYASGQYPAEGDPYATGEYAEGDYGSDQYGTGEYAEGDYAEGDYAGDYDAQPAPASGQYGAETQYGDPPPDAYGEQGYGEADDYR